MKDGDAVLIVWLLISLAWDLIVWSFTAFIIFWRGRSAWWVVLAIALSSATSLFEALRKRFSVPEDEK